MDKIKTLEHVSRFMFVCLVFRYINFCDHTFNITLLTIRAWVRQIGMKPGSWRVFCYCVDYSEFASFRVSGT